MKLLDLEPHFLTYHVSDPIPTEIANDPLNYPIGGVHTEMRSQITFKQVDTIEEAQGVEFLCPKCFIENKGKAGTHICICWSRARGVPDEVHPGPGRWALQGTGLHDLTLGADPPNEKRSVQQLNGCGAHFNVTNGEVELC